MKEALLSFLVAALSMAGMAPAAQAGVAQTSFQVALTILLPQPEPKKLQKVLTRESPGYPAYPVFQSRAWDAESAARKIVILKTEF